MVDRVRPRKLENPASGGTQLDQFDTDLDPNEDFVDVRGVAIQDDVSGDENVLLSRDAPGNMTFKDVFVPGVTLTDLLGGAAVKTQEVLFTNKLVMVVNHDRGQMPLVQVLERAIGGWGAGGWGSIPWGQGPNQFLRLADDEYETRHLSDDRFMVRFATLKTGKVLYF